MSTDNLSTETELNEADVAAANPETSSADNAASDIQTDTLQAVEAVEQRVTPLPKSVRVRAEELFTVINASRAASKADGGNWSKSAEDKQHIVELAGLLCEYNCQVPELHERTENGTSATAARKYLKTHSSVSSLEARVIALLRADLANLPKKEEGSRRIFSDEQKKKVIALAGLLRKQFLGNDGRNSPEQQEGVPNFGMNEFLSAQNLSAISLNNWKDLSQDEQGNPILTSELIRSTFRKAHKELDAESAPAAGEEDTVDASDANDVIFHKGPFKPVDEQQEQDTVAAASSEVSEISEVTPTPAENITAVRDEVRSTVATVLGQNQQVIDMLRTGRLTPDDKRILAALLEASNLALASSEGISLGRSNGSLESAQSRNGEAHEDAIVIRGNEIKLSPNTTGTLTMTETTLELGRKPVATEETSEAQQ